MILTQRLRTIGFQACAQRERAPDQREPRERSGSGPRACPALPAASVNQRGCAQAGKCCCIAPAAHVVYLGLQSVAGAAMLVVMSFIDPRAARARVAVGFTRQRRFGLELHQKEHHALPSSGFKAPNSIGSKHALHRTPPTRARARTVRRRSARCTSSRRRSRTASGRSRRAPRSQSHIHISEPPRPRQNS